MILLAVIAFLHLPSGAEAFRDHLSEALRLKCDAIPYRTIYVNDRCYVAVQKEIEYSKAPAECSSIFFGSKVAQDAPDSIFDELKIDKTKFHSGSATSGTKQLMCFYENGYKCDANEAMLSNGRCVVRAPKKMNFVKAKKYCEDLGMELPAPSNNLDNRIVRDALAKDPAWVDKSFSGDNGYKWKQGKSYSRWSTCNYTAGHQPRLFSGSQYRLWQCSRDMGSVVDKTGFWSNGFQEYSMEVVCLKNAENPFTKGPTPCDYHESQVEELSLPTGAACLVSPKTCYTSVRTTTRYEVVGKGTVETQRGCEVLCNNKPMCTAFYFKDDGLTSSCVLLSSATTEMFNAPTTIFLKKTAGCAARTNLTAEFGVDPCIDEMAPSAFLGLGKRRICTYSSQITYITRAIDACGRRITLDNDRWNWLEKVGDMWEFRYTFTIGKPLNIPIVAASCVRAGAEKCPCEPLKFPKASVSPLYPVTTDRENPCKSRNSWLWVRDAKDPSIVPGAMRSEAHLIRAELRCEAGM